MFSKLMRYRESRNIWAYHIALSKAARGERQKIEQNYLLSIYYLRRTEKHWLWKRKLKLDVVFCFFPAANVFPHKHAWLFPYWTLGSGELEAFLGGEGMTEGCQVWSVLVIQLHRHEEYVAFLCCTWCTLWFI